MTQSIEIPWDARLTRIEYDWVGPENATPPLIVFLHEGLGSLAMWKDFPERLCRALDCRALVLSRWGYGRSTPRLPHEAWESDFMHRQAQAFLPAFFQALGIADTRPWLLGHSDGGSIALLYAAAFPDRVGGLIALAPHIRVEELSLTSIRQTHADFHAPGSPLQAGLAKYHDDVHSAFGGWSGAWLHQDFPQWDIRESLDTIRCPVLAIQGEDDAYGTMAQIDGIAERVPGTRLVKLAHCGHSPHRDQPQAVIEAVRAFVRG